MVKIIPILLLFTLPFLLMPVMSSEDQVALRAEQD